MAIQPFIYNAWAARVVFGPGTLGHLTREIDALGYRRVLVLSTPEQRPLADRVAALLGPRAAGVFDGAAMHVPIDSVRKAREVVKALDIDCAVAAGGGSTTGLGKAIALDSGLPIVSIPTTYAGSEMTPVYGITEGGVKKTGKDPKVVPRAVIYDPELTLTLPARMSLTSGINAIAHAAEGLYAADCNPVVEFMARDGIAALGRALPAICRQPQDIQARGDALYGAWLCGIVMGSVGMALHHKLCHTLGGTFNLPHAECHTVVLPHALAYNAPAAPKAMTALSQALGAASGPAAVFDLARDNGAVVALRDLGMKASDLDRACDMAAQNQYPNPRPLERAALRQLLQDAWEGVRPD
jgi:maleylacetate reductase